MLELIAPRAFNQWSQPVVLSCKCLTALLVSASLVVFHPHGLACLRQLCPTKVVESVIFQRLNLQFGTHYDLEMGLSQNSGSERSIILLADSPFFPGILLFNKPSKPKEKNGF